MTVIIALLILGGLVIFSSIKSVLHIGTGKVDVPKSYGDYVSSAVRGRDVFNGPGKPLSTSLIGGIIAIFLWIFRIPYRISKYFLSKSKLKPWMVNFLSGLIAVVFWAIFILTSL